MRAGQLNTPFIASSEMVVAALLAAAGIAATPSLSAAARSPPAFLTTSPVSGTSSSRIARSSSSCFRQRETRLRTHSTARHGRCPKSIVHVHTGNGIHSGAKDQSARLGPSSLMRPRMLSRSGLMPSTSHPAGSGRDQVS